VAISPLLILGSGGFARETVEAVRASNAVQERWNLLGHLDDDPSRHGSLVGPVPVLGPMELVHAYPDARVVVCTGRPSDYFSRKRIVTRLGLDAERYATVVHPTASVAGDADIGAGSVLLAATVVTAAARIGRHVAVMPQVVVTHDDAIEDYVTIASGVRLGGGVHIGEGAYLGAGALVREGISVGAWALVGMGSLVLHDVPAATVVFGSPARVAREVPAPREILIGSAATPR
jgi:sugar O-acyltransferase (sialic acid O-acetyltransferase NeuD family)